MANLKNTIINDTGFITLPAGTFAQRPASPSAGMIRFNTEEGVTEYFDGSVWVSAVDGSEVILFNPISATMTGASNTMTDVIIDGREYRIHAFYEDGDFVVSDIGTLGTIDVLIVGGGGGGGGGDSDDGSGGGGGAGGLIFKNNESMTPNSYIINVGEGGSGGRYNGFNGQDTTAFGYTALGGGYGGDGDATNDGGDGGSGGGGGGNNGSNNGGSGLQPNSADGGFGNPGGRATTNVGDEGGGGGGAGQKGSDGRSSSDVPPSGPGGDGLDYSHKFGTAFGENGYFAGGGAGHADDRGGGLIPGGLGGGGDFNDNTREQYPGQDGTGGGGAGGGKGGPRLEGEKGGSGIVLIRYPLEPLIPINATGGVETDVVINGTLYRQHVFSGNTNYNFTVSDIGNTQGLVAYEIIADGSPGDRSGTVDLGYLQGEILRKIDPFEDTNTIFEHTSKVSGPVSGWSNTQNGQPKDFSVYAQAEVNGSCRNGNFNSALSNHYSGSSGRMPTLEEYINDATKGSGCGHDYELNWTVTKGANVSEHWIARGDQDTDDSSIGDSLPKSNTNSYRFRQVADSDINRVDPVILQDDLVLEAIQSSGHPYQIVPGPTVEAGTTYNLLLGSGTSTAIPHTGKQSTDSVSGISNKGTVVIRYPLE